MHGKLLIQEELNMNKKLDERTFFTLETCPDPKRLRWETKGRSLVAKTVLFELNKVRREDPRGVAGDYVELSFPRNGVAIVPVFIGSDGVKRFVMERQFRHGTESITLEFPAGLVERGEDPEVAARRELLEETGLSAGKLTYLGSPRLNSAFMDNYTDIFLAEELEVQTSIEERKLDADEQIDVLSVPVSYVMEHMGEGELNNGSSLMGLLFYIKSGRV